MAAGHIRNADDDMAFGVIYCKAVQTDISTTSTIHSKELDEQEIHNPNHHTTTSTQTVAYY